MRVSASIVLGVVAGVPFGVGGYAFVYARGASYLTDDPSACANCHVMREQFDGWQRSSHRAVAVCNDCHAPHDFVGKYATKATNGFWHSFWFTMGGFPDPITITPDNAAITEQACRHCHASLVHAIDSVAPAQERLQCVSCHFSVGHP